MPVTVHIADRTNGSLDGEQGHNPRTRADRTKGSVIVAGPNQMRPHVVLARVEAGIKRGLLVGSR